MSDRNGTGTALFRVYLPQNFCYLSSDLKVIDPITITFSRTDENGIEDNNNIGNYTGDAKSHEQLPRRNRKRKPVTTRINDNTGATMAVTAATTTGKHRRRQRKRKRRNMSTEKPTEGPVEGPVERPIERPVKRVVERSAERRVVRSIERRVERPTEMPVERPTERPTESPAERPAWKRNKRSGWKRDNKPLQCLVCSERFKCARDLVAHQHSFGPRPFACPRCFRGFGRPYAQQWHRRGPWSGHEPYGCLVCPEQFENSRRFVGHSDHESPVLRPDDGDSSMSGGHEPLPYVCDQCDQPFDRIDELEDHLMDHLREIYELEYITSVMLRNRSSRDAMVYNYMRSL